MKFRFSTMYDVICHYINNISIIYELAFIHLLGILCRQVPKMKKKRQQLYWNKIFFATFSYIHGFSSHNAQKKEEEFLHASKVINISYFLHYPEGNSCEKGVLLSDSV